MRFSFLVLLIIMPFLVQCQPRLKTTRLKMIQYNSSSQRWGEWPDEWTYREVFFRFTQLDVLALTFRVEITINGKPEYTRYRYLGYDIDNNWYKYQEIDGTDLIKIVGVKMSYLATKGWPDYNVQIYAFSVKDKVGFVFD